MFRTFRIAGIATLLATSLATQSLAQVAPKEQPAAKDDQTPQKALLRDSEVQLWNRMSGERLRRLALQRPPVNLPGTQTPQDAERQWKTATHASQFLVRSLQGQAATVTAVDAILGMSLRTIDDTLRAQLDISKDRGLAVAEVVHKGPASKAGLIKHDVIVTVNSQPVKTIDEFRKLVHYDADPNKPAHLSVIRGGKSLSIEFNLHDQEWKKIAAFVRAENPYRIGVSVSNADETLKTQLNIPKDQGLVVESVLPDGPAKKAGIEANDVLLMIGDQPLVDEAKLREAIQKSEGKSISIKLFRHGKPLTIEVVPDQVNVTLGGNLQPTPFIVNSTPYIANSLVRDGNNDLAKIALGSLAYNHVLAPQTATEEFFIGLPVEPLSEALRSHLNIPESQGGLITNGPAEKSPAEKAGFAKNDILLKVGDQPLKTAEELVKLVREGNGKPLTFHILQHGKPKTIEVTPEKHTVVTTPQEPLQVRFFGPGVVGNPYNLNDQNFQLNAAGFQPGYAVPNVGNVFVQPGQPLLAAPGSVNQKLDALRQQVEQLNKAMLELQKQLPKPGGAAAEKK